MRRTAVINFKNFDRAFAFIRENKILIILLFFFFAGLFTGVFSYDSAKPFYSKASEFLIGEYSLTEHSSFFGAMFDSFLNSLLLTAICFICGCSMLGVVLSPLCMLGYGLLYGLLSASLYSEYALKGIAFYAVMVLPSAVILIIALMLAAKESVKFSYVLTRLTFPASAPQNLNYAFKSFCVKYLIICLLVLLASLLDALLSCNLAGRFVL